MDRRFQRRRSEVFEFADPTDPDGVRTNATCHRRSLPPMACHLSDRSLRHRPHRRRRSRYRRIRRPGCRCHPHRRARHRHCRLRPSRPAPAHHPRRIPGGHQRQLPHRVEQQCRSDRGRDRRIGDADVWAHRAAAGNTIRLYRDSSSTGRADVYFDTPGSPTYPDRQDVHPDRGGGAR